MNYKAYIYIFSVMLSVFALSGINFDGFIKSKKVIEARILVVLLSLALGYLVTNFITDFMNVSQIISA
jgi:uncharacterized integral membrane protein (TIGR02327 family)